jgi:hypothetical protein
VPLVHLANGAAELKRERERAPPPAAEETAETPPKKKQKAGDYKLSAMARAANALLGGDRPIMLIGAGVCSADLDEQLRGCLGRNVCEVIHGDFEVMTPKGTRASTPNEKITRLTNAWEKNQLTFGGRTFLEPIAAPPAAAPPAADADAAADVD